MSGVKCRFQCGLVPWEKDESRGIWRWRVRYFDFLWDGTVLWLMRTGPGEPLFKVLVFELAMQFSLGYVAGRLADFWTTEAIGIDG